MIDFRKISLKFESGTPIPVKVWFMYVALASLATWDWNRAAQDTGGEYVLKEMWPLFASWSYEALPDPDGRLIFGAHYDSEGNIEKVDVAWEGGIIHAIAGELLNDLNPQYARVEGDLVFMGSFRFRILGKRHFDDVYILRMLPDEVKRIEP